ncbi:MAG: ATP-dependent DNA helicase, partial [Planctomycetota bacterium]
LGPIESDGDDSCLRQLEAEGVVLRTRLDGREAWCERRLLARIHRYTVERLRSEIRPVTAAQFLDYLACWQHVDDEHRLEGPRGLTDVVRQLAGFELPSVAWESRVLPARVRGYRREWLDRLTLRGELAWGRLWGQGAAPIRTTPLCLLPREDLDAWLCLAGPARPPRLSAPATQILELLQARGASFPQELKRDTKLLANQLELGLGELISRGLVTCDSFSGLRGLTVPPSRRRWPLGTAGRWCLFRQPDGEEHHEGQVEFVAERLLRRYGVLFRRLLARERQPIPWRELARRLRRGELQGRVRGGRFVAGFDGEQYALPEAVQLLRRVRRRGRNGILKVSAADPLNLRGILTPDERVSPLVQQEVEVG